MSKKGQAKRKNREVKKKKARAESRAKKKVVPDLADLPPLPDRRAIEGIMSSFFGGGKQTVSDKAQNIMYEAWDTDAPAQRIALAQKALDVCPNCADAYVLLAEEAAESLEEAMDLYRKGVEAGQRALGEKPFEEEVGYFWGLLETRPYMRARAGLAECLWEVGQRDEAIEHYKDLL
ncbi:MAG: hypothetical protein QF662_07260, partial [Phycisphaerae bacterium]|nr:hypothetical protein [Phycisphaerae bacterium]